MQQGSGQLSAEMESRLICTRISPQSSHTSCTWRSSTSGICSGIAPPLSRSTGCSLCHSTSDHSCHFRWRFYCTACRRNRQKELYSTCCTTNKHNKNTFAVISLATIITHNEGLLGDFYIYLLTGLNNGLKTMITNMQVCLKYTFLEKYVFFFL